MSKEVKREVTPAELIELAKRKGPVIGTPLVKIEGIAVIRDKDGNIKGKMKLTNEVKPDAT